LCSNDHDSSSLETTFAEQHGQTLACCTLLLAQLALVMSILLPS